MKIPRLPGPRSLRTIIAIAVAAAVMVVAHGLFTASPAQACTSAYVRIALSDQGGKNPSQTVFIDSRWPGRQIVMNRFSGFSYLAHGGVIKPGQSARFRYYRVPVVGAPTQPPPSGQQPTIDYLTKPARSNGVIHHEPETKHFNHTGVFSVYGEFTDCGGTVRYNVPVGYIVSPS